MKRLFPILILLALAFSLRAQNIVTATVTITNPPASGNTIVVNASTRTWETTVSIPATQILTNPAVPNALYNLFIQYASFGQSGVTVWTNTATTNQMYFKGQPGLAMAISFTGTWATVSYSTNVITDATYIRVPTSTAGLVEKTNVENGLADYLSDTAGTHTVSGTAPMFVNYGAVTDTNIWLLAQTFANEVIFNPSTSGALSAGNNSDVPTGTNYFVYLSGPTGLFTNLGFAGGFPNREVKLVNICNHASALVHLSSSESTATNRIFLGGGHTAGDVLAFTNMAGLWYDATSNFWRVEFAQ